LEYNSDRKSNQLHDGCPTHATGEADLLKPVLLLSAVTLFAFSATPVPTNVLGASPQEAAPPASSSPVKPTAASQAQAKSIYARDCALCHGENGNGKSDLAKDMQLTLLDWTDPKSLGNRSDKELFHVIREGKDKMPGEEEGRAKNDEVWNLIIYIRGFSKGQPAAAQPAPAAPTEPPPAEAPKPNN
jgi:mono/diheme cytochrome c family protein